MNDFMQKQNESSSAKEKVFGTQAVHQILGRTRPSLSETITELQEVIDNPNTPTLRKEISILYKIKLQKELIEAKKCLAIK